MSRLVHLQHAFQLTVIPINRILHLTTVVPILMFSFFVILIYLLLIGKQIPKQRHSKELS